MTEQDLRQQRLQALREELSELQATVEVAHPVQETPSPDVVEADPPLVATRTPAEAGSAPAEEANQQPGRRTLKARLRQIAGLSVVGILCLSLASWRLGAVWAFPNLARPVAQLTDLGAEVKAGPAPAAAMVVALVTPESVQAAPEQPTAAPERTATNAPASNAPASTPKPAATANAVRPSATQASAASTPPAQAQTPRKGGTRAIATQGTGGPRTTAMPDETEADHVTHRPVPATAQLDRTADSPTPAMSPLPQAATPAVTPAQPPATAPAAPVTSAPASTDAVAAGAASPASSVEATAVPVAPGSIANPSALSSAGDTALSPRLAGIAGRYQLDPAQRFLVVDQDAQQMIVWDPGQPVKTIPVSTGGADGYITPAWSGRVGRYVGTIYGFGSYADDSWYLFESLGSILIHGAPYQMRAKSKVYEGVDALGITPASHGCIRLSPDDARWLTQWNPAQVAIVILPMSASARNRQVD